MTTTPRSAHTPANPMEENTARLGNPLDAAFSQNPAHAHGGCCGGGCVGSVVALRARTPEQNGSAQRITDPFPSFREPVTCGDATSANGLLRDRDAAAVTRDLVTMAQARATLRDDLAQLAAAHHLGGWVNAVDALAMRAGDGMFVEVTRAASAVAHLLAGLGLDTGAHPLASETYQEATR